MIPLREALLCPASDGRHHVALLVLREGTRCTLLRSLTGHAAAIASSEPGLRVLQGALNLPVRTLEPALAAVLGLQTLLAKRQGRVSYVLGEPFEHP